MTHAALVPKPFTAASILGLTRLIRDELPRPHALTSASTFVAADVRRVW